MAPAMRTPSADELLDAWDAGSGLHRLERSGPLLRLLADIDETASAGLGVGERDRLLMEAHELIFGTALRVVAGCPSCGVEHELTIQAEDLRRTSGGQDVDVDVDVGGYHLRCRLPRVADLAAAAATGSPEAARELLVSRSVLAATRDGSRVDSSDLPPATVAAAAAALAESDPLAEALVTIVCDACHGTWTRVLDMDEYLWRELDSWGARLLMDIHLLATAYGWSEAQVLAVPPGRRRRYLELARHD